jgi:hypothetical protein
VRRVLTVFLIGIGGLFWRGPLPMAASTPHEVAQEAEAAFRSAMQAWAYEEYWRLWDMGSRASRAALSREDFTDRMRRGNTRPAAGRQVEALAVASSSPDSALLEVRFGLEDTRRPWVESTGRPFVLLFEDGGWKVNLWDFVSLANYFPSDAFLGPSRIIPPPHPARPKGP